MKVYFSLIGGMPSAPAHWILDLLEGHQFRQTDAAPQPSVTFAADLGAGDLVRFLREIAELVREFQWHPWSLLVTDQPILSRDGSEGISQLVLVEFWQTVWVDAEAFDRLKEIDPEVVFHFHWDAHLRLNRARWPPERPAERIASLEDPQAVDLEHFSNGPDVGAQATTIQANGFTRVLEIARRAYRDLGIPADGPLGGLNAVVLLSAEWNRDLRNGEPSGEFVLYNLPALGLRYSSDAESLANLVANEVLDIVGITAEPGDEREE